MIRVTVQTSDAGMAANVGGHVQVEFKSFDISAPDLEAHLREYSEAKKRKQSLYWQRCVIGVEVLPIANPQVSQ